MRASSPSFWLTSLSLYGFSLLGIWANPTGGTVTAGAATIQTIPGTVTITQQSNAAVINWQGFSIGSGEVTKFMQPGSQSAVLNRVVGGDPSEIFGTLQSNGKVFLINPNGILVGARGRIDTAGFVASSLDISDAQFMAGGDLKFSGNSQNKVSNLGTIHASDGDIYLLGGEVENKGTVTAPNGVAGLAGGHQILLKRSGDEHLFVDPTVPGNTGVVTNAGAIRAAQAELKANGGNLYALAINNPGAITVTGVVKKNGRILLIANGGTITNSGSLAAQNADGSGGAVALNAGHSGQVIHSGVIIATGAQGQVGGQVQLLGDSVNLKRGALVDASGGNGGGSVLMGGDAHGSNPSVMNAMDVSIEKGAAIKADAIDSGNGGKVVAWANRSTIFAGTISARGGAKSGNGGSAEVSGKDTLGFSGEVNLGAPHGSLGTLLLDPTTITLHSGAGTDTTSANEDLFEANLEAQTADIDLEATSGIAGTVNDPFTLTLQSNVNFTANVTGTGTLDFSLVSVATSGTGAVTLGNHAGPVTLNDLTSGTGLVSINGSSISVNDVRSSGVVTMATSPGGTIALNTLVENAGQNENYTTDHLALASGFNDYIGAHNNPTGTLTLQPATAGFGMSIGGTKSTTLLSLGSSDLLHLKFANVHFGAPGVGAIAIHDAAVAQNIEFFGATQTVDNTFGANSLQFATGGTTTLATNANLNTFGGAMTFDGGVVVTGNAVQLASNANNNPGGNIAFNSTINGPGQLTVLSDGGTLTFQAAIGGTTALSNLTLFAPSTAVVLPATTVTSGVTVQGDAVNFSVLPTNISQTGAIHAGFIRAAASGSIELTNAGNQISDLQTTSFGSNFHLTDSEALFVDGHVTGGFDTTATIEVHGGSLNLQAASGPNEGAQIAIQGAGNSLVLAADGGVNNNVGSSVLSVTNGARWVIYVTAANQFSANGLVPNSTTSNVIFPSLPPGTDGNTLAIGPIAGGTPTGSIQEINIVAGAAGTGADDNQLDDGQILFGDVGTGTLTVSAGKLDSLSGNITLQAVQNIILDPGVDLNLASALTGSTVTFQISSTHLTLGGDLSTGGASLVLDAGNGALSVTSLNAGVGTIALSGVGTSFTTGSTITGSALSINNTSPTSGIGTQANSVATAVGTLDATASVGGVFIANSGQVLNIGGFNSALDGVHAGAGAIQITNDHTINITDAVHGSNITGQANILVQANGATSDVVAADGATSINAHAGLVTVQAGRDILIGNGATSKTGAVAGSAVTINAGHSVVVDEDADVIADNVITVTAGTTVAAPDARPSTIVLAETHFAGAQLGTRGGAIVLTTAAGGFIDAHSGNVNGDLVTTLTAGHSNNIAFTTDDVNLATPINAGTGIVSFVTATPGLGVDLGTNHPAGTANYPGTLGNTSLSLTNAELNNITAGSVDIGSTVFAVGTNFSALGNITVSLPVTSAHFGTFSLAAHNFTNTGGINAGFLIVDTSNSISSPGALSATSILLLTANGGVNASGNVTATDLFINALNSVTVSNGMNRIANLDTVSATAGGGTTITIADGSNLTINGVIGQTTGSPVATTILGNSNITISSNGQVNGALVTIATGLNGHFTNNRGADAIRAGRFLVYSADNSNAPNDGILTAAPDATGHFDLQFGDDPIAAAGATDNAFYYYGDDASRAISKEDFVAQLALQSGQPVGVVREYKVQDLDAGPVTPPPALPDSAFLGFPPLPGISLALQEAYKGYPSSDITQLDLQMIMAGGGLKFTPDQVGLMAIGNQGYLEYLGYQKMVKDGMKDPGGAILADIMNKMPNGISSASTLTAYYVERMIDDASGPIGLTRVSDTAGGLAGTLQFMGVFKTTDDFESDYKKYVPPNKAGASVIAYTPPANGSTLLVPPGVVSGNGPLQLVSVTGNNVISNDGGSLVSNSTGTVISNDGGSIVAQGGGNIVAQGGGNIVAQGGGNIVAQGGGNIVAQGGGNIVAQGGGNIVAQGGGN